jgi:serine/threonine protein kinase
VPTSVKAALRCLGWDGCRVVHTGPVCTTYRGHHRDHGDVAIKVLLGGRPGGVTPAYWRSAFHREGRLLDRLRDVPGVVTAVATHCELEEIAGRPHFHVTRWAGRSLQEKGVQAGRDVAGLIHPVAMTLANLHGRSILHRDLKPSNLLFDGEQVRIADFGAAVGESPSIRRNSLLYRYYYPFSPMYAAPELFAGFGAVPGSYRPADCWSLGACLFSLYSGERLSSLLLSGAERVKLVRTFARVILDQERVEAYRSIAEILESRHADAIAKLALMPDGNTYEGRHLRAVIAELTMTCPKRRMSPAQAAAELAHIVDRRD